MVRIGSAVTPSYNSSEMDICRVVAAVIGGQRPGEVWAFRRSPSESQGGLWEFPGGKIQPKEKPEAALARELQEELAVDVLVGKALWVGQKDGLEITFFQVRVLAGTFQLTVHDAQASVAPEQALKLPWLRLDRQLLERLATGLGKEIS